MRRGIRARPIDPYRRMPITAEAGLVYDDEEDILEMPIKRNAIVELPIPEVIQVATYEQDYAADFQLPLAFVRFPIRVDDYDDNEIEYDLDHDDEVSGTLG